MPFTALPASSIPILTLLASTAAPEPKIDAPIAIHRNRPTVLATWPPKKDDIAAGIRIIDTTNPWTVDERCPKVSANWGISVSGPMVPISSLLAVLARHCIVPGRSGSRSFTRREHQLWR
jgi:hypothetical protein